MENCFIRPWKNAFKLKGRANRAEYWTLIATTLGGAMAIFALMVFLEQWWLLVPYGIWLFICFVPGFTAAIRRLHDINVSAWWMVAPSLIGVIAAILTPVIRSDGMMTAMTVLSSVLNLVFIVAMAWKGTPGPNRFGPQPGAEDDMMPSSMSLEKTTEGSQG
jgi:uncharacterized membrane protein YhaH (DUF805 family)